MATQEEFVRSVLQDIEKCKNKENFLEAMRSHEDAFIGQYENQVHDQLQPELKRKENRPPSRSGSGAKFLQANNAEEREYLQQFNRFNRFQGDSETARHLQRNFQQGQEVQFSQFVEPPKNFLDVEANTKYFYPPQNRPYSKDQNKPIQDFANTQNIYQNWQRPQGFQNPDAKDLYPRAQYNVIEDQINYRPQFFANQQKPTDKNIIDNIQKLGGIEDCLSIMEPSLRVNEVAAFQDVYAGRQQQQQQPQPQAQPQPDPFQGTRSSQNFYQRGPQYVSPQPVQGVPPPHAVYGGRVPPQQVIAQQQQQQIPPSAAVFLPPQRPPSAYSIPPFGQQPLPEPDPFAQTAPPRNLVINNKFQNDPLQRFEEQRLQQQQQQQQFAGLGSGVPPFVPGGGRPMYYNQAPGLGGNNNLYLNM